MSARDCKYRFGDTFHLPLDEVAIDVGENMREVHDPGLRELAESMGPNGLGQLLPILVVWRDGRFHVAAGFRRALAMRAYREQLGFTEILARRIRLEDADVARLVENIERENPSTFETCRYLYELREGLRGAPISVADLAAATGKSVRHIDNLIRFYRVLPDGLRKAWAADRDQRFTFAVLRELAVAAQSGDDAAVQAIVERTLKVSSPPAAVGGSHRPVSVATEIRVIPAESSGSPDQVFDGLGSAGYGGSKDAGWSWTSTPPTDRLSETDTLI